MVVILHFPELIKLNQRILKPDCSMKEIKKTIELKTGIKSQNQRINFSMYYWHQESDDFSFWDQISLEVYDISHYEISISKDFYYHSFIVNLNNNVSQLKKSIFEQSLIPIDRQILYHNNFELNNDENLLEIIRRNNIFTDKYSLIISKPIYNNILYIKYPNLEIKKLNFDLLDTGFELLNRIEKKKISHSYDVKYDLFYKDKIPLNYLLIQNGIKNGDLIQLKNRNPIQIFVKGIDGKTHTIYMEPQETIEILKCFIFLQIGIPINQQRLTKSSRSLEDRFTLADYNIWQDSTIYLFGRLRGGNNNKRIKILE